MLIYIRMVKYKDCMVSDPSSRTEQKYRVHEWEFKMNIYCRLKKKIKREKNGFHI